MKIRLKIDEYYKKLMAVGETQLPNGVFILNESEHIADEVLELSQFIQNKILNYKKTYGVFIIFKHEYKKYLQTNKITPATIEDCLFFNDLDVSFDITDYNDANHTGGGGSLSKNVSYKTVKNNNGEDETIALIHRAIIELHLNTLNGKVYPPDFTEPIKHEVNHLYQLYKKYNNKSINISNITGKLTKKYAEAKKYINSDNWYVQTISQIYYYLNREEQDAYVNGLYANLIDSKIIFNDIDNFIQNTRQYKWLNHFKGVYNHINEWNLEDDEYIIAKNIFFDKSLTSRQVWSSIKNFLNSEIPNFEKKLNGVVRKYKRGITENKEKRNRKFEMVKNILEMTVD
jgi:hypothetical protein